MISVVEAPSSFIIFSSQLLCSLKRDGKEEQNDFYICSIKAQAVTWFLPFETIPVQTIREGGWTNH